MMREKAFEQLKHDSIYQEYVSMVRYLHWARAHTTFQKHAKWRVVIAVCIKLTISKVNACCFDQSWRFCNVFAYKT